MSQQVKTSLPIIILLVTSITLIADYYLVISGVKPVAELLRTVAVLLISISMAVAVIGLTIASIKDVLRRKPGIWYFRLWSVILLYIWLAVGITTGQSSDLYMFLFNSFLYPAYATVMGLTMFAMFSAFYRALRLKNIETTVLIVSTILCAIGNAPIGQSLWNGFPIIKDWIIQIPVAASERGLAILGAAGLVGIAVRTMIGQNRIWMGILHIGTVAKEEE